MNRFTTTLILASGIALMPSLTHAGTIMKLGFSTDSKPDIAMIEGVLQTADDDFGATFGDQNTEVTFLGVLSGVLASAIEGDRASFSLSDVQVSDDLPTVIGTTLLQPTMGGDFILYDPSNNVLLSGTLGNGTLSGPIGGTATGGFLTTEFGSFTGGSLLATLETQNLSQSSVSISLTDVNDGLGLSLDTDGRLMDFTADATANIGARQEQIPEPAGWVLLLVGLVSCGATRRR